jgi:dihydropteroate synthase
MTASAVTARTTFGVGLPQSGRCLIMGVLNVTPDSFSDGGHYVALETAVCHGLSLMRDGADIVDVGGESTRPGAARTSEAEELNRVIPVVSALARAGVAVTIDTMRRSVAAAAVSVGAIGVNDVSGGLADPTMASFIAEARVLYIATHWRAPSHDMANHAVYRDVVADVAAEMRQRLTVLERAGVDLDRVVVDPGLGFAKTADHNWQILHHLRSLRHLGHPIMIGASRKSFLRALLSESADAVSVEALDSATAAVSALAAAAGVYCVRVHDAKSSALAINMAHAWATGGRHEASARDNG